MSISTPSYSGFPINQSYPCPKLFNSTMLINQEYINQSKYYPQLWMPSLWLAQEQQVLSGKGYLNLFSWLKHHKLTMEQLEAKKPVPPTPPQPPIPPFLPSLLAFLSLWCNNFSHNYRRWLAVSLGLTAIMFLLLRIPALVLIPLWIALSLVIIIIFDYWLMHLNYRQLTLNYYALSHRYDQQMQEYKQRLSQYQEEFDYWDYKTQHLIPWLQKQKLLKGFNPEFMTYLVQEYHKLYQPYNQLLESIPLVVDPKPTQSVGITEKYFLEIIQNQLKIYITELNCYLRLVGITVEYSINHNDLKFQNYSPDILITIVWQYQPTSLKFTRYLCVEVDEPYVYKTGQPHHYIGSDVKRNKAMLASGLPILRFSELQVLLFTNEAINLLIDVVKTLLPSWLILLFDPIKNYQPFPAEVYPPKSFTHLAWTKTGATLMATRNWRSSYLSLTLNR